MEISDGKSMLNVYSLAIGLIFFAIMGTAVEMFYESIIDRDLMIITILTAGLFSIKGIHTLRKFGD